MLEYEFSAMYRPRCIALGLNIGNNKIVKKKWKNIFIELDILFWTFGFELKW